MSRYVSGERIPKAPLAIRMADVLGVDVKELYGWDDKHVVGEPAQPETHEERTETHACDCISRQAAVDAVSQALKRTFVEYEDIARTIIGKLPSAQPEIIRCKECKYNSNTCGNYVNCDIIPQMFGRTTDNFCSRAERRTDE